MTRNIGAIQTFGENVLGTINYGYLLMQQAKEKSVREEAVEISKYARSRAAAAANKFDDDDEHARISGKPHMHNIP